ncbi:hypothetical protein D1Q00_gp026 [Trichoplusia ni granulovirus LBIV-12]|jgi:hypothetical protein|uniref:Uncharacterized protein n=2 Tax=Betabaculovirus TaxID=558017 RepID=A0A1D8QL55_GVTN|nr:hypothetical protein PsunGV_gp028 [Pseudalatia unipuncta granulovirus]YP_009506096.1 hypothetical protein D1Q00_gp026 [Trichoplusia ni granulovirus LBIV-12]ACH69378.1 unknown [Pseudalatia unipuncta granulovirus]AOW41365.1 hypothetical protein [Trichoplusia ni granulovirus LBIV-12]
MSEAYLICTTFNDILKFFWPVVLEVDTLRLWYSLTSIVENFDVKPTTDSECRSFDSFKIVAVLEDDDDYDDVFIKDHSFIDYNAMRHLHVHHCDILDSNLHTIIDQFVYNHLPKLLSRHLSSLRLITIFDVTDFVQMLRSLEMIKKYWLFRYKVVTMKSLEATQSNEEDYVESKKDVDNNNLLSVTLIDSLKTNLEIQFKHLNTVYPENATLHTTHAFVKLASGTVGLLEELLHWN